MAVVSIVLPGLPGAPVGGAKVVYEYSNYLVARGHDVHIVHMVPEHVRSSLSSTRARIRRTVDSRLQRHARPEWFTLDPRVAVTSTVHVSPRLIPDADVLIATAVETAHVVADAVARRHVAGLYFIQHYEDWVLGPEYVDETWRLPLRKIVIAPWLQHKAELLGVDSVLVPNGIDASEFPLGPPISARPLQVMALVSPREWKRSDIIADAMAGIALEMPAVRFRTFGVSEKTAQFPAAVEHIRRPSAADLRALYQQSRILICASDAEGWHLPSAEAMSSGAAVVSTDNGGVRAYADGIALFSPTGDAASLAQNALRLLADDALCTSVAEAGAARIRLYSPERAARAFEREIFNALESQPSEVVGRASG